MTLSELVLEFVITMLETEVFVILALAELNPTVKFTVSLNVVLPATFPTVAAVNCMLVTVELVILAFEIKVLAAVTSVTLKVPVLKAVLTTLLIVANGA